MVFVGRCEDVGLGSLLELEPERLAPREYGTDTHFGAIELERDGEVGERLRQRGRREDDQLGALAATARLFGGPARRRTKDDEQRRALQRASTVSACPDEDTS